jgi:membrane protein involved in colicin uptake
MGRVYLPSSEKPKKDEAPVEAGPVTGRVYLPPSQSPRAAAKEAKAAAKAEARAKAAAEAAVEEAKAKAAAGVVEPAPDPTPATVGDQPDVKPDDEPAGNASRDAWAEYARTSKGAGDSGLVDEDGNDLGRDALREKYGTPSE